MNIRHRITRVLLMVSLLMMSQAGLAVSYISDSSGHVPPRWPYGSVTGTIGYMTSGSYQFGEPIKDTMGRLIESEYTTHFHLTYARPKFYCVKKQTYWAGISAEGMGPVAGERDGYAIIRSNIPGIGYRMEIGGLISGNYTKPNVDNYTKISASGANNISMYCESQSQFAMEIKVTLVRTDEPLNEAFNNTLQDIQIASPFPQNVKLYNSAGELELDGTWTLPLKNRSNIRVKYITESCRYNFSNKEQIINLGKVGSRQFTGPGSTAYGEYGPQSVDIVINCGNVISIRNIRASIFEDGNTLRGNENLRAQGVLQNNLTGKGAAKGIGVQVLIDNAVKPLGSDSPVYINDATQWDVINSYEVLRGLYRFTVSGRYYQTEPDIHEGLLQTTAGFTLIYR